MSRDPLEEIWHEYVDDNPEMTVKELESPVRFVRYLLRKRHVVPGWLIWFPIAQLIYDVISSGLLAYLWWLLITRTHA